MSRNFHYVFGITSFGRACGTGAPGVYTRVTAYLDWIESIVWPTDKSVTYWKPAEDYRRADDNRVFNYSNIFDCGEDQKICLKKIRSYYKKDDPYWPEVISNLY